MANDVVCSNLFERKAKLPSNLVMGSTAAHSRGMTSSTTRTIVKCAFELERADLFGQVRTSGANNAAISASSDRIGVAGDVNSDVVGAGSQWWGTPSARWQGVI